MKNCEPGLIKYSRNFQTDKKNFLTVTHVTQQFFITPFNGNRTATKYHIRETTTELNLNE